MRFYSWKGQLIKVLFDNSFSRYFWCSITLLKCIILLFHGNRDFRRWLRKPNHFFEKVSNPNPTLSKKNIFMLPNFLQNDTLLHLSQHKNQICFFHNIIFNLVLFLFTNINLFLMFLWIRMLGWLKVSKGVD